MGKKIQDTKIGKLLFSKVGKSIIKSIPFVGDLATNVMESNNSAEGKLDKQELPTQLIRMAILIGILYLALSGKISFDDAEAAKQLVSP